MVIVVKKYPLSVIVVYVHLCTIIITHVFYDDKKIQNNLVHRNLHVKSCIEKACMEY